MGKVDVGESAEVQITCENEKIVIIKIVIWSQF
jgi:hypothetical protein